MTNYRPVDSKREEYRKYLERAGVMETLTRILVSLYEEQDKGIDALEYVRSRLLENDSSHSSEEQLRAQISQLTSENTMLRKRLSQYEDVPPPVPVAPPAKSQTPQQSDAGSLHSSPPSKTSGPTMSPDKVSEHHTSVGSAQKE